MSVTTVEAHRSLPMVIAATSLGFLMVRIDGSIVNVALARMGTDLGVEIASLQWVVDAYTLAFASLLLSAGARGDRIGVRRVFVAGFAVFTTASFACALSASAATLIASRAVQGIGAALMVPCSLALLSHACRDDEATRTRSVALWAAVGGIGVTAGPALGGLLVGTLGWRSAFLINVPIGVLGIWLTLAVAEPDDPAPRGKGLDLGGQVLAILALVSMTGAVIESGPLGWSAPLVQIGIVVGVVAAIAFVLVEMRSSAPMLPLDLFRNSTFSAAAAIGFIVSLTIFGLVFLLSLYFQQVLRYSAAQTGLAFVPFGVMTVATNIMAGRVAARIGVRPVIVLGLLVAAAGYAALLGIDETTSYATMLPGQLMIRIGVALTAPSLMSATLMCVDRRRSGIASGALNTSREAASAFGVAIFGVLIVNDTVAGIQAAIALSGLLLLLASGIAFVGIRRA
jgi:DHA2 family methylenomycin A resistance protein-like MFS transporter